MRSVTIFKTLDIYFQIALRKVVTALQSHQYCIVVSYCFSALGLLCLDRFFRFFKTHLVLVHSGLVALSSSILE